MLLRSERERTRMFDFALFEYAEAGDNVEQEDDDAPPLRLLLESMSVVGLA